ncbi:MAG: hypothetical protein GTO63_13465 [Anaerolineae bacterium]|nr:hypothetical protein [Anaerolineae bacterium]
MNQMKSLAAIGALLILGATAALMLSVPAELAPAAPVELRSPEGMVEAQADREAAALLYLLPSEQWQVLDPRLVSLVQPVEDLSALKVETESAAKSEATTQMTVPHLRKCGNY